MWLTSAACITGTLIDALRNFGAVGGRSNLTAATILKVLERTSRYDREHEEKSYPPSRLDYWVSGLEARSLPVVDRSCANVLP